MHDAIYCIFVVDSPSVYRLCSPANNNIDMTLRITLFAQLAVWIINTTC